MKIWGKLYDSMGREKFDPLVEQRVNQKLFEGFLKTCFEVPSQAAVAMVHQHPCNVKNLMKKKSRLYDMLLGLFQCLC